MTGLLTRLRQSPRLLGAVTAVLTVLMVAPEREMLAVSVRSALAIGVVLALEVILALSPGRVIRGRDALRAA
ncbi:MAG TPA: hypothetical protein VG848_14160 [Acetobacteraceae bacterium]|nr:hypothetical protein [Acetobacteraceae bacterium]